VHQRRQQLGLQVGPRLAVPEEAGDVDENGVEERGELLRVQLEVVLVVLV
jgi:hypothetical protein